VSQKRFKEGDHELHQSTGSIRYTNTLWLVLLAATACSQGPIGPQGPQGTDRGHKGGAHRQERRGHRDQSDRSCGHSEPLATHAPGSGNRRSLVGSWARNFPDLDPLTRFQPTPSAWAAEASTALSDSRVARLRTGIRRVTRRCARRFSGARVASVGRAAHSPPRKDEAHPRDILRCPRVVGLSQRR
jgi:hypothetical protein